MLADTKNPVLKLPVRENVFGSQPNPIPVTRQLPRNHLSLPVKGRRAWDATGQMGQTGRSSRWSYVHSGNMGKPCAGRRARDLAYLPRNFLRPCYVGKPDAVKIACPVWRGLGGNVPPQGGNAPPFHSMPPISCRTATISAPAALGRCPHRSGAPRS